MFRAFAYLLTAVLAFAPPALGQPAPGVDQKKLTSATMDWLKADVDKGRIPGAVVLVARDGKIAAARGGGLGRQGQEASPMRATRSIRSRPRPS